MMKKMKSSRARLYLWGGLLLALMLGVMFAEYLIPWDAYAQDLSMAQQPPSAMHLLGTDRYGRDMLARVLVGGRTSIWGRWWSSCLSLPSGRGSGQGADGMADGSSRHGWDYRMSSSLFPDWSLHWPWQAFPAEACCRRSWRSRRSAGLSMPGCHRKSARAEAGDPCL